VNLAQRVLSLSFMLNELMHILATILFPPLGVWLRVRFQTQFWVSLVLTLMCWLPGLIHGVWLLAQTSEHKLKIDDPRATY